MKNPLFKKWVDAAFEKTAWPFDPQQVARAAPANTARNIHRGGRIISEMGHAAGMVPEAAGLAGKAINGVLAPAGEGGLRALGHVGDYFRKNPHLMRLGIGAAVTAPILWDAFNSSQQNFEKDLMAMNRDPSRVITASLDEFLEKKANQAGFSGAGWNGPGVAGGVSGKFYNMHRDIGTKAIDSFTGGIGEGLGKGLADTIFGGLGSIFGGIRDAVITNPKRQAMVDTLMRNDPVIADAVNRNPNGREIVMEAYGTMVRFAPKLSTDINATRSFLREAVLSGSGVNYATIKNLIETEKTLTGGFKKKD